MLHTFQGNLQHTSRTKQKNQKFSFTIFKPAGNDTALISGIITNSQQRKVISTVLQDNCLNVEQVGFINLDPEHAELMMAGGEFCGNATSSAAYHILDGKKGKIAIKVSGVKKKLLAGVTSEGEGFSQMPVHHDTSYITSDPDHPGNFIVELEGITHYIDFDVKQIKGLSIEQIKQKARKQMSARGIDQNSACGVIYVEKLKDVWTVYPVVYVRDVDTLYYETACGSGATALGLVIAQKKGRSIRKVPILQPSGLLIKVSVAFDGVSFGYVQIQSLIKKVREGTLKIPQKAFSNIQTDARSFEDKLRVALPKLPGYKKNSQVQVLSLAN